MRHTLEKDAAGRTGLDKGVRTLNKNFWKRLGGAACLAGLLGLQGGAQAGEVLNLGTGEQRAIGFRSAVTNVAVGDPDTANVSAVNSQQILVTAKKAGITTLMVWLRGQREPQTYDLVVGGAMAGDAAQATEGAGVASAAQVQSDVKIVEVSRRGLKEAGLLFARNSGSSTIMVGPPGSSAGVSNPGGAFNLLSNTGFLPISDAYTLLFGNAKKGYLGVLSALQSSGMAYTLAEPSLVAMSGQSASFLAGGEFPVPVLQNSGGSNSGSNGITIEFKEFGVRLTLTPTVLDANRIMLKVAPEVSELDFTAGITASGVSVPALRVRRTDTSIQLGDGESFVISGLVSQNTLSNVDKIPFLGDLPILGAFFRSTRFDREDKELIMVVTPHLVQPLARDAALPTPPGESYRTYNPGFRDMYFNERGSFGSGGDGFSD